MCGICGIAKTDKLSLEDASFVKRMTKGMFHRGPDAQNTLIGDNIAVGVCRLAIIDIKAGNQPMSNETGTVWVVFNGEIYNFIELREELVLKGHVFVSQSDTEVIVHLYEEYGIGCLEKLNGMFAVAIMDKAKETLLLGRDRLGIKPLYYSAIGQTLCFASEINSLLLNTAISRDIDSHALDLYLSLYYIPAPRTIYKQIKRLPAAHYLLWEKGRFTLERYWQMEFGEEAGASEHEWNGRILNVLEDTMRRQLISDVPLGVFLSGGLDSTALVALASRVGAKNIPTFSLYFSEPEFNENEQAGTVAKMYGTHHNEWFIDSSVIRDYLPLAIQHLGEPTGDWTCALQFFLSKKAKEKVTVVLSGLGGDELFAGYPTLTADKLVSLYNKLPYIIKKLSKKAADNLPVSMGNVGIDVAAKKFVSGAGMQVQEAHFHWKEIFSAQDKKFLYAPQFADIVDNHDAYTACMSCISELEEKTSIFDKMLYYDIRIFLEGCLLTHSDAVSMANSLEMRVPLLDNELIELSSKIPFNLKHRKLTTKYIFRKSMTGILPPEVINKKKMGFVPPTSKWIKTDLLDFVRMVLFDSKFENSGLLNQSYIANILDRHINMREDNGRKIAALVSFAIWYNKFG